MASGTGIVMIKIKKTLESRPFEFQILKVYLT
jgi:hypothetical protein